MNTSWFRIVFFVTMISIPALGKDSSEEKSCGEAAVIEGYECSDAKVQFKFPNCLLKSEPQLATGKSCKGDVLTAFYEKDRFRYEATFTKSQNNWGATIWTNNGVKQLTVANAPQSTPKVEKNIAEKKVKAPKDIHSKEKDIHSLFKAARKDDNSRAPASLPAVVAKPAPTPAPVPQAVPQATPPAVPQANPWADGTLKFSGFADLRFTNLSRDSRAGESGMPESGFGLEDGALYLNYQKDALSFMLDVPFRRMKNSDNGVTNSPNASPNGNMVWGNDKAQAYLKYTFSNFEVAFGQFDTVYGVEVNDSKDRFFSKEGLVYTYLLPVTHTGALVSYNFGGGYARLLTANPNNKGSLGTSTTGDNNYEYGAVIGYTNESIRGQLGYLSRPIDKASGIGGGKRSLVDATAGATLGKLSLDFEYSVLADDSKNTLTPGDTTDKEANGLGALALVSYNISNSWAVGARFEHLENDPGQVGISREDSYGVSAHYKWFKSLETRVEFIQNRYRELTLPSETLTDNRFEISNIFNF